MAEPNMPLRKLADAIQALAVTVNSDNPHIKVTDMVQFCRVNFTFVSHLNAALQMADLELKSKVDKLEEGSKTYDTIQALVEGEIENGSAKKNDGYCRSLVRLKRVIELVRVIQEQILASSRENSLFDPFKVAYEQVYGPYHGPAVKEAVIAALENLPSKGIFFILINEDEDSVKEPIQKYITASKTVLQYVDNIFLSTETGAELLRMI